jgi:hypothetical protein
VVGGETGTDFGSFVPQPGVRTVGTNLRVDLVTVEVSARFAKEGIPHLLLKGPSIASWLYEPGGRGYGDSDLLVPPDRIDEAFQTLHSMGFQPPVEGGWNADIADGAWIRPDNGPAVDLHRRILGTHVSPQIVWDEAYRTSSSVKVLGREVRTLGITARSLHITLHAAQHASGSVLQVREDLKRALRNPEVDWVQVLELAHRWAATDAFAAGLSLRPEGRILMKTLGVSPAQRLETRLRLRKAPALALHLAEIGRHDRIDYRLRSAFRRLFPKVAYMRERYHLATHSPLATCVAYVRRVRDAMTQVPPTAMVLLQLRRVGRRAAKAPARRGS